MIATIVCIVICRRREWNEVLYRQGRTFYAYAAEYVNTIGEDNFRKYILRL